MRHGASPFCALPGWAVTRFSRLDSTNAEAQRILAQGDTQKRVIVADSQSAGQCRHDRRWESAPGLGLWVSFIMPAAVPAERLAQSTLVFAVAVREAVAASCGVALEAKWPNDLLHGGKKCCGLLVETSAAQPPGSITPLILGVGVNIAHGENDFPKYLRGAATSLRLLSGGRLFPREELLQAIGAMVDHWFAVWTENGFAPVREAWLKHNCTMNKKIILPDGYGYSHATAFDLDSHGALTALTDDGTALRVDSGEIRFAEAPR